MQVVVLFDVFVDCDDMVEQVVQVGGDGDFLDWELDFVVFDLVVGGVVGIIVGYQVDVLFY